VNGCFGCNDLKVVVRNGLGDAVGRQCLYISLGCTLFLLMVINIVFEDQTAYLVRVEPQRERCGL